MRRNKEAFGDWAAFFQRGKLFDPARPKDRAAFLKDCRAVLSAQAQAGGASGLPRDYVAALAELAKMLKALSPEQLNGRDALPEIGFGPRGNTDEKGKSGWRLELCRRWLHRELTPENAVGTVVELAPFLLAPLELDRLAKIAEGLGKGELAAEARSEAEERRMLVLAALLGFARFRPELLRQNALRLEMRCRHAALERAKFCCEVVTPTGFALRGVSYTLEGIAAQCERAARDASRLFMLNI